MTETLRCISPIDGTLVAERELANSALIDATLARAASAQKAWQLLPVDDRQVLLTRFVDSFVADKDAIAEEISRQMGRPLRYCGSEVAGLEERARHMIAIAPEALA